jgi:hypothetical protein
VARRLLDPGPVEHLADEAHADGVLLVHRGGAVLPWGVKEVLGRDPDEVGLDCGVCCRRARKEKRARH